MDRRSFISVCGALAATAMLPFRCLAKRPGRPHLTDDNHIEMAFICITSKLDDFGCRDAEAEVEWRFGGETEWRRETLPAILRDGQGVGVQLCDNVFVGVPCGDVIRDKDDSAYPIVWVHGGSPISCEAEFCDPTGGTFSLGVGGSTVTNRIAFNASREQVQHVLDRIAPAFTLVKPGEPIL